MAIKAQNTALLVFVRDPNMEADHKVFAENLGFKANKKLAKVLNRRVIQLCKQTNIPTYIYSSSEQKGETFGARLANAFESVFDRGYENVIAVGNDCLSITCDTIRKAENKLQGKEMVLGPARDGGLYLIGLSKNAFQKKQFTQFNWTTEHLTSDFINFADHCNFELEELESASDIDNAVDFKFAIQSLSKFDILLKTIEEILSISKKGVFLFEDIIYKLFYLRNTALRGPPVLY